MRNKQTSRIIIVLVALAVIALISYYRNRPPKVPQPGPVSGKLLVHFLDIGQGDCELIQLPGGETILIDSGDRGASTVELLRKYGVKEIDLAIATHPHADHMGEMVDVLRAFKVKEVWDPGLNTGKPTYTKMLEEIDRQGTKFLTPRRGDSRMFKDALLEVLNPGPELDEKNVNNASIVVRLTFGSKRFLFTGDAEIDKSDKVSSAWEAMLQTEREKLRADLLKSAHHGSHNGTNAQILDAVRPTVMTISCATGNDYGHPHQEVMQLLESRRNSISLYRTDLQGTILAVCDGNTIEMSTEKQVAQNQLYKTGNELAGTLGTDAGKRSRSAGKSD
jgi:competence protein ComEC